MKTRFKTNLGAKVTKALPNLKTMLPALALGAMLCCAGNAQGQIYAQTADNEAPGSGGFGRTMVNTGTDAISIDDPIEQDIFNLQGNLQVMVWDGDTARFSWTGSQLGADPTTPAQGYIDLTKCYRDPDVVVHKFESTREGGGLGIYAMVTYEDINSLIWYEVMKWNGTTFLQWQAPGSVGNNNEVIIGFTSHTPGVNPNIDVNSEGKVVITWHESYSFPASITVTYPGYSNTINFDVIRSEVYAAYGHIDGTSLNGAIGLRGVNVTSPTGDQISVTGNLLYEHNKTPDVTISERDGEGQLAVTFTYVKKSFQPFPFSSASNWVIDQRILTAPLTPSSSPTAAITNAGVGFFTGNAKSGAGGGRPRIASRKIEGDFAHDFEVVTGPVGGGCNDDGYYISAPIYNFGRYQNVTHPVAVVNISYSDMKNYDPVVSYRYDRLSQNGGPDNGEYVVAWTIELTQGYPTTQNKNVLGRMMRNGNGLGAISFVNYAAPYNSVLNNYYTEFLGTQDVPSVAGRYSNSANQYLYVDRNTITDSNLKGLDDAKFKGDPANPGSDRSANIGLKTAGGGDDGNDPKGGSNYSSTGITAYPNPFNNEVQLRIVLDKEEVAKTVTVQDLAGRKIDQMDLQGLKAGVNMVNWKAKTQMPSGIYLLRLQTDQKVTTFKMIKE